MPFELHPNLIDKIHIIDLPLCCVLMEDEKYFPWLFLVPRIANVSRIMDLSELNQLQLIKELHQAQKIMWDLLQPAQLNVAAIGNKTPQLHIHVIARYEHDPAWPNTVWDYPVRTRYDVNAKNAIIDKLKKMFSEKFAAN